MHRSQPIDMNSAVAKRLGLTEEALQRASRDRKIVKTETVDDMFPFAGRKPGFSQSCCARWQDENAA